MVLRLLLFAFSRLVVNNTRQTLEPPVRVTRYSPPDKGRAFSRSKSTDTTAGLAGSLDLSEATVGVVKYDRSTFEKEILLIPLVPCNGNEKRKKTE